jgi:hypothetical protein
VRPRGSTLAAALAVSSVALGLAGCSIQDIAADLARTMAPIPEDAGADAASADEGTYLEGRAVREAAPPEEGPARCTLRGRLCFHGEDEAATSFLEVAEGADQLLAGLPVSMQDALFSGGAIRFVDGDGGARTVGVDRLAPAPRVVVTLAPSDRTTEAILVRALEVRALQRNPATTAHDATTLARAVARRFGLLPAIGDAPPEAAALGPTGADRSGGDGAFLAWLDERVSADPGALLAASLAKASRGAGPLRARTAGDPWFVLTRNFAGESDATPRLDEYLLRHAIERSATVEGRAALAFRWDEPLPMRARRLLTVRPVEPTGVAWARFERAPGHPSSTLVLSADWEEHARFRLFAQLIGADGKLLRTQRFTGSPRTPHLDATLEALDGVASIVIGALNVGDPAAPFDPREGPWEPHALLLTVAPMDGDGGFL